jgi:glyoxylase-like metal-dependent hydrolase (beta-lactamase superfamily II)
MKSPPAEITPIVDEDCFDIALHRIFPAAEVERLRGKESWLCPDHLDPTLAHVRLGMKSWLVRAGTLRILVDTCIGQHKQRPGHAAWHLRSSDRLLRELARCGLAPSDIDVVLCTHLHADHVGWNTRLQDGRWVPTFPNARYAMSRRELDDWQRIAAGAAAPVNHGALDDSILPVVDAGLAMFVAAGDELLPGISITSLAGHTIDHFGLSVRRPGRDALFCGDAIHSPLQLAFPHWTSAFCHDPERAIATRIAMLEMAADTGCELLPAHFRGRGSLGVRRHDGAYLPA